MRRKHAHPPGADAERSVTFDERLGFELIVRDGHYARFLLPDAVLRYFAGENRFDPRWRIGRGENPSVIR